MPRPVLTKADFVRRYQAGEFGNHSPTWDTLSEFSQAHANITDAVHLRNSVIGGWTYYNVMALQALSLWAASPNPRQWYCSAMAPTEHTLFQGEVMEGPWGLNLTWTNVRKPMRDALAVYQEYDTGLTAKHLLQRSMNDLSWEWLQYLLESYPDHVIEFSVYDHCWGTHPGHNTVFWEVRKY